MKHFFFLLFILLTWYMAAMYRLHSLMVLAVAELMLLFFLFLLSRYFKRSFQAGFCNGKEVLRQGEKTGIRIWTENRAVFPIGRYRLDFYCGFKKPRQKKIISREGSIDSRKREVEELYWEFPWCGRFYVSLVQRQVYDYLSLFRARMKDDQETEISVLPSCQPLLLKFSSLDSWENRGYGEEFSVLQGNSGEVRQLREYGPGDLVRRIHWKQSARTDKILVKEFQREEDLFREIKSEEEATGGVVILGLGLVLAGFLIEYILHAHWLLYLAVTFLILLTPLFGHSPGNWTIFLMAVFQLSFWTMTGVKKMSGQRENDLRNKIAIGMFLGFGGIFALAFCVVGFSEESLYQAAYGAEGSIQRTVKQITGLDMSAADGNVSRGNLYPTGTDQLELITDKIPTETMYLKGFTGGDYERGEWLEDRDEEIYTLMEENSLHWGRWEDWIPGMYESLYYVINQNMKGTAEANTGRALMVRYIGGWRGDWYAPYYGIWSRNNQRYADDLYGFRYFQQDEMNIQWDNLRSYFSENGDTYREVQEAYEKEAAEIYTQVPQEEIPRLTELCRTNPMGDLEHITAFILYTLQSNASYTQTPGMFPFNEDPVEYFLFQGKEGYCQHFASAAVLMYRLYGVPARYATGYAVSPSDFELQSDGTYRAVVTDESAHAWPEIFIHDYGWTPVEVTPLGQGVTTNYPGFDSEIFQDIMTDTGWNLSVPSLQTQSREETKDTQNRQSPGIFFEVDKRTVWKGILTGAGGIGILCLIFYRRWKRRDQWIQKGGMGRLFDQLLFDLHFSGRMKEYQGWEKDFAYRLAEEIPAVTLEETEQLLRGAREEAFGEPGKQKKKAFRQPGEAA